MKLPSKTATTTERLKVVCLALSMVAIVLAAPTVAAQDTTPPPAAPESISPPIEPIAGDDIAGELETLQQVVAQATATLDEKPNIRRIEDKLPDLRRQIDEHRATEARILEQAPARRLRDFRSQWGRTAAQLLGWERLLSQRVQMLNEARRDLETSAGALRLTLETDFEPQLPAPILGKARDALTAADDTRDALRGRIDQLLTLQVEVGDLRQSSLDEAAAVEQRIADVRVNILHPDGPPIWRVLGDPASDFDVAGQIMVTAEAARENLELYMKSAAPRILIQTVGGALIVGFLIYARRRGLADAADSRNSRVLDRPLAAGLLVAIIAGGPLHPTAPTAWNDLVVLLGLLALMRLLPRLLPAAMRPVLYGVGGVALLHWTASLLPTPLLADRILWMLVAIVGLMVIPALGSGVVNALGERPTAWRRAVPVAVRAGAGLLVASLVINLAGNLTLASLLASGTLMAVYLMAALWTVAIVVDDLAVMVLRSGLARRSRAVREHPEALRTSFARFTTVAAVITWVFGVLEQFHVLDAVLAMALRVLGASVTIGSVELSPGDLLMAVVVLWLSFKLSLLLRFLLEEEVVNRISLPTGVPATMSRLTHYVVMVIGFFIALALVGFDLDRIALVAGAFGVGIGFGLQTIVNNFVSGLILLFERPIRIGDRISLGALSGVVTAIGIRASRVRTWDGAEVTVPNGTLIASELVNWTLSDSHRRVEIAVGVAYGSDPDRVLELLVATAAAHPEAMDEPGPHALFTGFGESSLDFSLRLWCPFETHLRVASEVRAAIARAFDEAGLKIPFPQRDLHLRTVADPVGTAAAVVTPPADG